MALRIMYIKFIYLIGSITRDLPACSIVPESSLLQLIQLVNTDINISLGSLVLSRLILERYLELDPSDFFPAQTTTTTHRYGLLVHETCLSLSHGLQ
jgi:hypothetical protein